MASLELSKEDAELLLYITARYRTETREIHDKNVRAGKPISPHSFAEDTHICDIRKRIKALDL
jgi:hypothetical protein